MKCTKTKTIHSRKLAQSRHYNFSWLCQFSICDNTIVTFPDVKFPHYVHIHTTDTTLTLNPPPPPPSLPPSLSRPPLSHSPPSPPLNSPLPHFGAIVVAVADAVVISTAAVFTRHRYCRRGCCRTATTQKLRQPVNYLINQWLINN